MTDTPNSLDSKRGMAAQQATEIRRLLSDVEANEQLLRQRYAELEDQLLVGPATTWVEAADKARYLLRRLSDTPVGQDPRRQALIASVLADFDRLGRGS